MESHENQRHVTYRCEASTCKCIHEESTCKCIHEASTCKCIHEGPDQALTSQDSRFKIQDSRSKEWEITEMGQNGSSHASVRACFVAQTVDYPCMYM